MIKILHLADIHYSPKQLEWVDKAMANAVQIAEGSGCDLSILAGDSFDHAMSIHEPAVTAYVRRVAQLADIMPVLVLQGTFSHDRPGALDVLRELRTKHRVYVVDEPERLKVLVSPGGRVDFDALDQDEAFADWQVALTICALPSLNKADPTVMEIGASRWVQRILEGWGKQNAADRARCVPSILVTHGTVTGCSTESGYAMVAPDHEFSLETLACADAEAVLLGHIHRHQVWPNVVTPSGARTSIAYPGSLARLVHGHRDPVGFLIWDIQPQAAVPTFHESPSRQLLEIAFDGPPNFDDLRELAETVGPQDAVRIRWEIDEEHAGSVDKAFIRELFAAADTVKLEARVLPVQRVRADGIGRAATLAEKLRYWCETTDSAEALERLTERLEQLRSLDTERIVGKIVGKDEVVDDEQRKAA